MTLDLLPCPFDALRGNEEHPLEIVGANGYTYWTTGIFELKTLEETFECSRGDAWKLRKYYEDAGVLSTKECPDRPIHASIIRKKTARGKHEKEKTSVGLVSAGLKEVSIESSRRAKRNDDDKDDEDKDEDKESSSRKGTSFSNENLRKSVKEWLKDANAAEEKYGHISAWDALEITSFSTLFWDAKHFNEDTSRWDTGMVMNMDWVFMVARRSTSLLEVGTHQVLRRWRACSHLPPHSTKP